MKKQLFTLALVACVCGTGTRITHAWWAGGHETITTAALKDLTGTGDLYTFLNANSSILIADSGHEPTGAHYIDIDTTTTTTGVAGTVSYGTDYANFVAGTFKFPLTTADATARYGSSYMGVSPAGSGGVPWYANDVLTNLTNQMIAAKSYSDWTNLLSTAGALAHLTEDMHNPMHLASNYDGQMTGQTGLHARYEGEQLENGSVVRYSEILAGVTTAAPINYGSGDGFITALFNRIPTDYNKNAAILSADLSAKSAGAYGTTAYNDALWAATKNITINSVQDASVMVASALYTAYVAAGSPAIPAAPVITSPSVTAAGNATVQSSGPRTGSNGTKYFNIEGANNGSYADYGVIRFDTASIKATLDAQYGVGNWTIADVALSLAQSPAAFSADGAMKVFWASDNTTSIANTGSSPLRYSDKAVPLGVHVGTDTPVLSYTFHNTGGTDNYDLGSLSGFSGFANEIMNGDKVTLVFYEADPGVAATYAGGTGLSLTVSARAVPEPASLCVMAMGVCGLLVRRRRAAR
jgi:hypothetical protein